MATLSEIKQVLGVQTLKLNPIMDAENPKVRAIDSKTGESTKWLRQWDNTNRIEVLIHEDQLDRIKQDINTSDIILKSSTEASKSTGESYKRFIIAVSAPAYAEL